MPRRGRSAGPSLLLVDDPSISVDKSVYLLPDGKIGASATEPHLKELILNSFDSPRLSSSGFKETLDPSLDLGFLSLS